MSQLLWEVAHIALWGSRPLLPSVNSGTIRECAGRKRREIVDPRAALDLRLDLIWAVKKGPTLGPLKYFRCRHATGRDLGWRGGRRRYGESSGKTLVGFLVWLNVKDAPEDAFVSHIVRMPNPLERWDARLVFHAFGLVSELGEQPDIIEPVIPNLLAQ
jgi:hypothetical protein